MPKRAVVIRRSQRRVADVRITLQNMQLAGVTATIARFVPAAHAAGAPYIEAWVEFTRGPCAMLPRNMVAKTPRPSPDVKDHTAAKMQESTGRRNARYAIRPDTSSPWMSVKRKSRPA